MKPFLVVFSIAYLGLLVGWRGYRVWKQTGINPFMLQGTDDLPGFVIRSCKVLSVCIFLTGAIYCVAEESLYPYLLPIEAARQSVALRWLGYGLAVSSLAWMAVAQGQMGQSWRIGIDRQHRTTLVETGLFRLSRNPIFFGMIVSFVGIFLILPSAVMLTLVTAIICLLQVQVRLEEDHLRQHHGAAYAAFQSRVPRWLPWPSLRRADRSERHVSAGQQHVPDAARAGYVGRADG